MRKVLVSGAIAALLGAGIATTPSIATAGTPPTDLYVDNATASSPALASCSDTGPGSKAAPFCTIQAAANVVQPGQTVHVMDDYSATGLYPGEVDITRSGAPGQPITFVADVMTVGNDGVVVNNGGAHAFTVTGAHDVVISGFTSNTTSDTVDIVNSSNITINGNFFTSSSGSGIALSGQTSGATISRNRVYGSGLSGISVTRGSSNVIVTTNAVSAAKGSGISVDGAPGTVVTSNSVRANCDSGILVTGGSTGVTIENNIPSEDMTARSGATYTCPIRNDAAEITVSADSTQATHEDYNLVSYHGNASYNWAGVAYTTLSAFQTASGQGAHDLAQNPNLVGSTLQPVEGSPAIDSADANAPGELSTDLLGNPRVDDPLVPNTGTGSGHHDRGAYEFQDPYSLTSWSGLRVTPSKGPYPLPVTATATVSNPWSTPASYSFDFGDGSAPVVTSTLSANHTYAGPTTQGQKYTITVTATLPNGKTFQASSQAEVNPPAPLVPALKLSQDNPSVPDTIYANVGGSTDSWAITDYALDFGDGTPVEHTTNFNLGHRYAAPGTYTVTLTERDGGGNTATISRQITVGSPYVPINPARLLDTRNGTGAPQAQLGPNGTVSLHITGTNGVPTTGVQAVVLNVTVTNPSDGSYLSVYPDGGQPPLASNLNYTAGQTVPNLVTVPVGPDGKVDFYNHSGNVDVIADIEGYYRFANNPSPPSPAYYAGFLVSTAPTRLLDTRDGTGAPQTQLGPDGTVSLQITGTNGIPTNRVVQAAVLNVTVTNPSDGSYLTAYGDGAQRPLTSNLNYAAGKTTSNTVIVPVGPDGKVNFYNHSGNVDVIADLQGYFTNQTYVGKAFIPLTPTRLLDTRTAGAGGPVQANTSRSLLVASAAGIPSNATVVLNVTVTDPTWDSFLTVYPDGTPVPNTSNLNFGPGETVPNLVTVPVGANGKVDFYNHNGTVDVVADVFGYFTSTPS